MHPTLTDPDEFQRIPLSVLKLIKGALQPSKNIFRPTHIFRRSHGSQIYFYYLGFYFSPDSLFRHVLLFTDRRIVRFLLFGIHDKLFNRLTYIPYKSLGNIKGMRNFYAFFNIIQCAAVFFHISLAFGGHKDHLESRPLAVSFNFTEG